MEKGGKGSRSRIAREPEQAANKKQKGGDGSRIATEPAGQAADEGIEDWADRRKDWTPEERKAAREFIRAAIEDYNAYDAMSEDDIEEEYRRAGKLHKYDPETELSKRYARVAKKHPPPAGFDELRLKEYFKLIEDEDD
jgi:hypothetical protein